MEESIFDYMERVHVVDHVLLAVALAGPILISAAAALLRRHWLVTRYRDLWIMGVLAGPALLGLWTIYNAVVDRWGLDSLFGLGVNALLFTAISMAAVGLRIWLHAYFSRHEVGALHAAPPETQDVSGSRASNEG